MSKANNKIEEALLNSVGGDYEFDIADYAILQLVIQYPSISQAQIAKQIGFKARQTVAKRMRKESFKTALSEYNKSVFDKLVDTQTIAATELRKILQTSKDESVKIRGIKLSLYSEPKIMRRASGDEAAGSGGMPAVKFDFSKGTVKPTGSDDVSVQS